MMETNEYEQVLRQFSRKSLQLYNPSDFQPVLRFFFMDALAHVEYTLGTLAYNFMSIRNEISREYLRWRVDEEEKGDRRKFRAFVNWLKKEHPEDFDALPEVWQVVYDDGNPARYTSFRLVLDPDSNQAVPAGFFFRAIDEFFDRSFLMSLDAGSGRLAKLFTDFALFSAVGESRGD